MQLCRSAARLSCPSVDDAEEDIVGAIRTLKARWRGPLAACLCLITLAACGRADLGTSKPRLIPIEVPAVDPQIGLVPSGAAVFEGRLWLTGGAGGSAVSFGLNDDSRKVEFADGVVAMTKSGDALWLLRKEPDAGPPSDAAPGDTFFVSRLADDSRRDSVPFRTLDPPQAFAIDGSTPIVVATQRLYTLPLGARAWETRAPRGMHVFEMDRVSAAALNGNVYIATNRGEFGGGFRKVAVATGAITDLARGADGKPCPGCESINDLLPDPASPGCLLASVGYTHLGALDGRILRICGDRVSTVFERPIQVDNFAGKLESATEPFFNLAAASPSGFWAVGPGTLYRFGGLEPERIPIPDPKRISRFFMNRDVPGLILIYPDGEPTRDATPAVIPID